MVVDVLINTRFLLLDVRRNEAINLHAISISQDEQFRKIIFYDERGIAELGTYLVDSPLQKYAYGYQAFDLTFITKDKNIEEKLLDLSVHSHTVHGFFSNILSLLWFAKDNSISTDFVYIKSRPANPPDPNILTHNHRNAYTSTCEQIETVFSEMEINYACDVGKEIRKSCPTDKNAFLNAPTTPEDISNPLKTFSRSEITYHSYNRLEKALLFLSDARMQAHVLSKISAYCSMLECLFSTEKTDISYKISQRVALYLGNDYEERIYLKKLIAEAYNIRSRFVHGNALSKSDMKLDFTKDNLVKVSKEIDNQIRVILTKIIFSDHAIFNNDEKLIAFFDTLIFH